MIDDEPDELAQALGPEPTLVAIPGDDQQTSARRRLEHLLPRLHSADMAASLYDAEMPGGAVRFAEFLHIEDGKIPSLRLLYDPSEYRSRGGR